MPKDLWTLKSLLPPRLLTWLRRLRELARRARSLHLSRPRARREAARQEVEVLEPRAKISLIMPTYKTELRYLRSAVDSVLAQHYPEWELIVVDDGSDEPELNATMEAYAAADPRIAFEPQTENGGISAATNTGLALCEGEFVGFLDHDDELTPDALLRVAQALAADPALDVVYSDSDKLSLHGVRVDPFLKPDWSPVYALGAMYIGHLLVVRRSVADDAGGFDPAFDTIQDFEFFLRVCERTDRIHHIQQTLYHWRAIPGSIAAGTDQKSGVEELQARAVSAHLARIGVDAVAVPHETIPHRAVLAPRNGSAPAAEVGIVIARERPSCESLDRLLASIRELTEHASFSITVVEPEPGPLRRGRANNRGAAEADGEYLLFLSEDLEVTASGWLGQLLLHAGLPGVGAVGPLLTRPDGLVDKAGVAIGLREPASPMLSGFPADGDGYYGALPCAREVSALSAECLLIRRADFEAAGGFNEFYASRYEDFDLCLRLAGLGLKSVYTPRARLLNHRLPAAERAAADLVDRALFVDCWYDELERGDPYFNPGFGQQLADYVPANWRERVYRAAAPLGRR
jgi:GT2 family glycosyltransferase